MGSGIHENGITSIDAQALLGQTFSGEEMNLDHFNMCVAEKYFDDICYPPELPNELHRQTGAAY